MKRLPFYSRGTEYPILFVLAIILGMAIYIAYRYWTREDGTGIGDIIEGVNPLAIKEKRDSPLEVGLKIGAGIIALAILWFLLFSEETHRIRNILSADFWSMVYGPGGVTSDEIENVLRSTNLHFSMSGKRAIIDLLEAWDNHEEYRTDKVFQEIYPNELLFLRDVGLFFGNPYDNRTLIARNFASRENVLKKRKELRQKDPDLLDERYITPDGLESLISKLERGEEPTKDEYDIFGVADVSRWEVLQSAAKNLKSKHPYKWTDQILKTLQDENLYDPDTNTFASPRKIMDYVNEHKYDDHMQEIVQKGDGIKVRFKSWKAAYILFQRVKRQSDQLIRKLKREALEKGEVFDPKSIPALSMSAIGFRYTAEDEDGNTVDFFRGDPIPGLGFYAPALHLTYE